MRRSASHSTPRPTCARRSCSTADSKLSPAESRAAVVFTAIDEQHLRLDASPACAGVLVLVGQLVSRLAGHPRRPADRGASRRRGDPGRRDTGRPASCRDALSPGRIWSGRRRSHWSRCGCLAAVVGPITRGFVRRRFATRRRRRRRRRTASTGAPSAAGSTADRRASPPPADSRACQCRASATWPLASANTA